MQPSTAFSLITELIHQDALHSALSGRDDVLLEPILGLLVKHVADPRYGELVCDVSLVLLGTSGLVHPSLSLQSTHLLPRYVRIGDWAEPSYRCALPKVEEKSARRDCTSARIDLD